MYVNVTVISPRQISRSGHKPVTCYFIRIQVLALHHSINLIRIKVPPYQFIISESPRTLPTYVNHHHIIHYHRHQLALKPVQQIPRKCKGLISSPILEVRQLTHRLQKAYIDFCCPQLHQSHRSHAPQESAPTIASCQPCSSSTVIGGFHYASPREHNLYLRFIYSVRSTVAQPQLLALSHKSFMV